ncbi:MAG: AI-2E family transporter [Patescibacteria group bacterium]
MPVSTRPIILTLFAIILIANLIVFQKLFAPLVIGLIAAIFLYPVYQKILKLLKNKRGLSAFIVTSLFFLFLIGPVVGFFSLLLSELTLLLSQLLNFIDKTGFNLNLVSFLSPLLSRFGLDAEEVIISYVLPLVSSIGSSFYRFLVGFFANIPNLILNFFLMIVSIYFLLKESDGLLDLAHKIIPLAEQEAKRLIQTFEQVVKAIFWGQFLTALIQGILGGFGFWFAGIKAPVFWGTVMAFFSLIPFVGPAIVYLPAALILFIKGDNLAVAILYLAYNLLIVSSVDNIIKPAVIGKQMKIHPVLILFALVGGIKFFGFLGIIYGPLLIAVFLLFLDLYLEKTKQQSLF